MLLNDNNQFSHFLNHPLLLKYDLKAFIILNSANFKLVISDINESIGNILHDSNSEKAVAPGSLFAKHRTVFLSKENIGSYYINLNNYSHSNISKNILKMFNVDSKKYQNFIIDLAKESLKSEISYKNGRDDYLHNIVIFSAIDKYNFLEIMTNILNESKSSNLGIEKHIYQQSKFELFLEDLFSFKLEDLFSFKKIEKSNYFLESEISKITLLTKLLSLEKYVEYLRLETPTTDDFKNIYESIQYITINFPTFSFQKNDYDINRLSENLEHINFFNHYKNIESLFYTVKENSNIFDNIYDEEKIYQYHATFGVSKEKILLLCAPIQTFTFSPYICDDLFQKFLDTANLYFKYENLYVTRKNFSDNDRYDAYIYSDKEIDIKKFKSFFQEAILAYKESGDKDFNPQIVHSIFHKNIIEKEIPQNNIQNKILKKF